MVPGDARRLFPYEVDPRFRPVLALFGFRAGRDGVDLDATELRASFGPFRLVTPLSNLAGAHVTGDYRWWTAVGARRSFVDDGLTFGTNARAGVCLHFRDKVPSPLRRKGHSALTVTVADCAGLEAAVLRACGAGDPPTAPQGGPAEDPPGPPRS